jgi:hypothetical protein
MTDVTVERGVGLDEPDAGGALPARDDGPPAAGAATALPDGVQLPRLLALVRLSAPQALEVAAGLLAEAAGRGDAAVPDRAVVGTDGAVVLGPATDGGRGGGPAVGDPAAAVAAVLTELSRAARPPGRPPDPAADELLAELDRAVTDLPDDGVTAVAARLQATVAGIDRTAVRGELAALVRAVGARAASARAGSARAAAPAGGPSTGARTAALRRSSPGEIGTVVRRLGAWLLSVVVLAAGVAVEVAVLQDDIAADVALLLDAGRSGSASSTAPEPDGPPVVPPAPAAAGSVAGVDLRPLAGCVPAAPCAVRLQVRLVPGPEPQVVTWTYRVVDRCTGTAATVPGGSVTAPAGAPRVAVVGTVTLPDQPAVAVVAVTSLPAAAASTPVSAGSCPTGRPAG